MINQAHDVMFVVDQDDDPKTIQFSGFDFDPNTFEHGMDLHKI